MPKSTGVKINPQKEFIFLFLSKTKMVRVEGAFSLGLTPDKKIESKLSFFSLVRVEGVEPSSQVWKTCILTAVLH
ncbi:MAG: hypothetical protein Q4F56_03090, partial [Candidatus Saccharibacteria bacterium]|nr:hypothetical protein [Candidatus Saccharibacteria bacterium]